MKLQRGFTLVELLIVVAIIGILAAVAVPAYSNYVTRAKIPEATSNLATLRVAMEQYYQDNKRYDNAGVCGVTMPTATNFTFACVPGVVPSQTYIITATGNNPGPMNGYSYTIDETNDKTSTIVAPADPTWIATSANCWITKTGGGC